MYMRGDAVRVSPQDISTLVKTSPGVYCLEFGDLQIQFARTGPKKRPVVTDAMRTKQKQTRIAYRDLLEKVDVTKMGKEEYNRLLKRKTSGCATTEDLVKIQKYLVQMHYEDEVDAAFVTEFNRKQRAIYNRIKMHAVPSPPTVIVTETMCGDGLAIPQILETLKALGYSGWDDRTTVVDFASLSISAALKLHQTLEFTKSIFNERETDDKSVVQRLNGYMKKIVGYQLLRKQIGKAKVVHYVIRDLIGKDFLGNACLPLQPPHAD